MSDNETAGREQFFQWLNERFEQARELYHERPHSENPRESDLALGQLRAYRHARDHYAERYLDTGSDSS